MDAGLIIAVAAGLCLISGLIIVRLGVAGQPARRIAVPVVELWVTVAIWIMMLDRISAALGEPTGGSQAAELQDLASRAAALEGVTRLWVAGAALISVVLVAHLMVSLRRMMSDGVGI